MYICIVTQGNKLIAFGSYDVAIQEARTYCKASHTHPSKLECYQFEESDCRDAHMHLNLTNLVLGDLLGEDENG